jgi:hypothetical protein
MGDVPSFQKQHHQLRLWVSGWVAIVIGDVTSFQKQYHQLCLWVSVWVTIVIGVGKASKSSNCASG